MMKVDFERWAMNEFDLIARHFAPLRRARSG
jgi:hypothetical protein